MQISRYSKYKAYVQLTLLMSPMLSERYRHLDSYSSKNMKQLSSISFSSTTLELSLFTTGK